MVESYEQKLIVFMSYLPLFWCSRAICKAHKTRDMFERHDQKLYFFTFYGRFQEILPTILGFLRLVARLVTPHTRVRVIRKKSLFSCLMAVFMSYCLQFGGSMGIFIARKDTIHV